MNDVGDREKESSRTHTLASRIQLVRCALDSETLLLRVRGPERCWATRVVQVVIILSLVGPDHFLYGFTRRLDRRTNLCDQVKSVAFGCQPSAGVAERLDLRGSSDASDVTRRGVRGEYELEILERRGRSEAQGQT
jgi:hypothetical protein